MPFLFDLALPPPTFDTGSAVTRSANARLNPSFSSSPCLSSREKTVRLPNRETDQLGGGGGRTQRNFSVEVEGGVCSGDQRGKKPILLFYPLEKPNQLYSPPSTVFRNSSCPRYPTARRSRSIHSFVSAESWLTYADNQFRFPSTRYKSIPCSQLQLR